MDLKDKKVLLMGLGLLGGGVATARFLVEKGALLTVTDMKDREYLQASLERLKDIESKIKFVLGRHDEKDFLETDILVINPDVPASNQFVEIARKAGKQIENELTLFYKFCLSKNIIGITGTRGKTTTTNWIGHVLQLGGFDARVIGNDPGKPFLSEINYCKEDTIAVIETPSFQLEIFDLCERAPNIAIITNIYQDHLSRHKTMEGYVHAKANIFKNQTENDFLILNKENIWTNFFMDLKPKSKVFMPDTDILNGFDCQDFAQISGNHNLSNFLLVAQACLLLGVSEDRIIEASKSLPQVKWREELVFKSDTLEIYNDTAATSPEGVVAGIERFVKSGNLVLLCGGTDRELDYKQWGNVIIKNIKPENLILLSGSATEKMKKVLGWQEFNEKDTLKECFEEAVRICKNFDGKSILLFSPGAKSFEKFKNEFDRGEKFNLLVKELK